MDLNEKLIKGLQILGEEEHFGIAAFSQLITSVIIKLTESEEHEASVPGIEIQRLKDCFFSLSTLVVEACRKNIEESELRSLLEDFKWSNEKINEFLTSLKSIKRKMQINLFRNDSSNPHIVNADWRLDYSIKSNQVEKLNDFNYMISLQTQGASDKVDGKFEFSCSIDQLQDLVSKLKDASKTIEKASHI